MQILIINVVYTKKSICTKQKNSSSNNNDSNSLSAQHSTLSHGGHLCASFGPLALVDLSFTRRVLSSSFPFLKPICLWIWALIALNSTHICSRISLFNFLTSIADAHSHTSSFPVCTCTRSFICLDGPLDVNTKWWTKRIHLPEKDWQTKDAAQNDYTSCLGNAVDSSHRLTSASGPWTKEGARAQRNSVIESFSDQLYEHSKHTQTYNFGCTKTLEWWTIEEMKINCSNKRRWPVDRWMTGDRWTGKGETHCSQANISQNFYSFLMKAITLICRWQLYSLKKEKCFSLPGHATKYRHCCCCWCCWWSLDSGQKQKR